MGTAIFPKHILEQYVDDGTFAEVWDIATDPGEIVGTGPYTIESYVVGESVILRRHTDYWLEDDEGNRLPYLEKIVNIVVPDFDAELAAFIAGETDVHGVLGEELERLEPLQREGNFTIHRRGPQFGFTLVGFNQNPGSTRTRASRTWTPSSWSGSGRRSSARRSRTPSTRPGSSTRCSRASGIRSGRRSARRRATSTTLTCGGTEYDLDKARELLDGLGWVDTDGDGVREDSDANPIGVFDGHQCRQLGPRARRRDCQAGHDGRRPGR